MFEQLPKPTLNNLVELVVRHDRLSLAAPTDELRELSAFTRSVLIMSGNREYGFEEFSAAILRYMDEN